MSILFCVPNRVSVELLKEDPDQRGQFSSLPQYKHTAQWTAAHGYWFDKFQPPGVGCYQLLLKCIRLNRDKSAHEIKSLEKCINFNVTAGAASSIAIDHTLTASSKTDFVIHLGVPFDLKLLFHDQV